MSDAIPMPGPLDILKRALGGADERAKRLEAENARLRAALKECADELEQYVDHEWEFQKEYPRLLVKYERAMSPVRNARELLGEK